MLLGESSGSARSPNSFWGMRAIAHKLMLATLDKHSSNKAEPLSSAISGTESCQILMNCCAVLAGRLQTSFRNRKVGAVCHILLSYETR